tara:strand:+ start:175 stop:636 length:462 start_codon:yes stop_codon:yes gene_type:complete
MPHVPGHTANGNQVNTTNGNGNGNGNIDITPMPETSPEGNRFTQPQQEQQISTTYKIVDTNQLYNGLVVNLGGNNYTTKGGAYEGIFSKLLTVASERDLNTQDFRNRTPRTQRNRREVLPGTRNVGGVGDNGGIVIDDPMGQDPQAGQGGGQY